jgi:hypothetical protein
MSRTSVQTGNGVSGISLASTTAQTAPALVLIESIDSIVWRGGPRIIGGAMVHSCHFVSGSLAMRHASSSAIFFEAQ